MADQQSVMTHTKGNTGPARTKDRFGAFASAASGYLGSRWAFLGAIAIILIWAGTGPIFKYSDTWQLIINTGTTIVTFLMVFLIQNTQNRDAKAINLKLDELICAVSDAKNQMIDIEHLPEADLDALGKTYEKKKDEPQQSTPQRLDELELQAQEAAAVGNFEDNERR